MLKKISNLFSKITTYEISGPRWCKVVIGTTLFVTAGAALLVFTVDPHYRYRLPVFYDTVYYQLYATAPRLLKDLKYDTLYIGSSMTRNIYINDINKIMDKAYDKEMDALSKEADREMSATFDDELMTALENEAVGSISASAATTAKTSSSEQQAINAGLDRLKKLVNEK